MTLRQLLVIRILLLIARLVADDETKIELKHLSNHISANERQLKEVT